MHGSYYEIASQLRSWMGELNWSSKFTIKQDSETNIDTFYEQHGINSYDQRVINKTQAQGTLIADYDICQQQQQQQQQCHQNVQQHAATATQPYLQFNATATAPAAAAHISADDSTNRFFLGALSVQVDQRLRSPTDRYGEMTRTKFSSPTAIKELHGNLMQGFVIVDSEHRTCHSTDFDSSSQKDFDQLMQSSKIINAQYLLCKQIKQNK